MHLIFYPGIDKMVYNSQSVYTDFAKRNIQVSLWGPQKVIEEDNKLNEGSTGVRQLL